MSTALEPIHAVELDSIATQLAERYDLAMRARYQASSTLEVAINHAIECGQMLNAAKALVKHGEWEGWVRENFPGGLVTAWRWAKLATQAEKNPSSVKDLRISAAGKELDPDTPKASVREVAKQLQGLSDGEEPIIDAQVVEDIDPRILRAEQDFQRVVVLMAEAHELNEVAAADKRREAARLAKSTATSLMGMLG